ncbi:MAG: CoA transferase [Deltaproteobacteria bacterium]|nr:CoA transferase [Deltaproteobacteria bacterium]
MKPLRGIVILDISRLLPGGFTSLLLAKQGARVIKIEQPGVGDYYRALTGGHEFVELGHFAELHRGKEFMALDLSKQDGKNIFRRLVQKADVVLENFRPGTLKRLGIGFPVLQKWNRKIILCSITGAGQKNRLAGHDLNYLALSGLLSLITDQRGEPVIPDFQVVDLAAGYRAAFLILSALYEREFRKRGRWIQTSMMEAGEELASLYQSEGGSAPLRGLPNYGVYKTRDKKHIAFAALEPKFIRNFSRLLGKKIGITQGWDQEDLQRIFRQKNAREWGRLSQSHDFCLSPVLSVTEACGLRKSGEHLPPMGRDNRQVLRRLGYSKKRMRELKKAGVL